MTEYELSYISSPSLDEQARNELDTAITDQIDALKGTIDHDEPSSRRRLGYLVQKHPLGFLRTLQIQLDPAAINQLRDQIKKHKSVLRLNILQTPRRQAVTPEMLEVAPKQPKESTEAKPAKEMTMEEVEEKIEEALEEEVK